MKTIKSIGLTVCLAGMLMACNNETKNTTMTDTMGVDSVSDTSNMAMKAASLVGESDATFMKKAAEGGMTEVAAGKIAEANGSTQPVRNFGGLMVKDHTSANNELMALAKMKNVMLPAAIPADMQSHLDEMQKMSGKSFDSHFVDMMVNDHNSTIAMFEEATKSTDPDVKKFASRTLNVIKGHYEMAKKMKSGM